VLGQGHKRYALTRFLVLRKDFFTFVDLHGGDKIVFRCRPEIFGREKENGQPLAGKGAAPQCCVVRIGTGNMCFTPFKWHVRWLRGVVGSAF